MKTYRYITALLLTLILIGGLSSCSSSSDSSDKSTTLNSQATQSSENHQASYACIVDTQYYDGSSDDSICVDDYPKDKCTLYAYSDENSVANAYVENNDCLSLGFPIDSLIESDGYNWYYQLELYSNTHSTNSSLTQSSSSSNAATVSEDTIDANGGQLSTTKSYVNIEANTFNAPQKLAITVTKNSSFNSDTSIDIYALEGVPENFSKPITVAVKQIDTQNTLMLIRKQEYIKSLDSTQESYSIVEGILKNGYLTYTFEPSSDLDRNVGYFSAGWAALQGYKILETKKGHFRIRFPDAWINEALDLENYLEEVYSYYETMGFDLSRRTSWPMQVNIFTFNASSKATGYYVQGKLGTFSNNYGYININSTFVGNANTMKSTAVHEFFHFVQSLYYPSTLGVKHGRASTWFDEATAVWSEGDFMGNGFTPDLVNSYILDTFNKFSNTQNYGYAMATMVKYIVDENSKQSLKTIYSDYYNDGSDISNNVVKNFGTFDFRWWPKFIQALIEGKVYDSLNPIALKIHAKKAPDLAIGLEYIDKLQLSDWQTALYYFNFPSKISYTTDVNLSLEITGDIQNSSIVAFNYDTKSKELVKVESTGTKIIVKNINTLYKNGSFGILVAITNSHIKSPYNEQQSIEFKAETSKLDFTKLNEAKIAIAIDQAHFEWKQDLVDDDGNPIPNLFTDGYFGIPSFWEDSDYLTCPITYISGVFTIQCHSSELNYDVDYTFRLDLEESPTKFITGNLSLSDPDGSSIQASYINIPLDMSNIKIDEEGYVLELRTPSSLDDIGSTYCNYLNTFSGYYLQNYDGINHGPFGLQSYDCSQGGTISINMYIK